MEGALEISTPSMSMGKSGVWLPNLRYTYLVVLSERERERDLRVYSIGLLGSCVSQHSY